MKKIFFRALCVLCSGFFSLSACGAPTPSAETQAVNIYATSAAQFWLADLYKCAGNLSVTLKVDANEPDIYLRLGEPDSVTSPIYKIGEEEILIAVNNVSPIQNLSLSEAQQIFTQGNPSVQTWVFSSGEDIQSAFDQLVLRGNRVTSSARVATSVEQMSATLNSQPTVVGILPRRAIAGNLREVFSAGVVPVLAITKQEPQGAVSALVACLQGN